MSEMDEGIAALEATSSRLANAVLDMSKRLNTTERMQKELESQQQALAEQQQATHTQRGINWILGISLALDIILSIAVGYGYVRSYSNAQHIAEIQTRTSDEVLCPLYEVFLQSVNHPAPSQINTPEKKARFEAAAKIVRDGYAALGCQSLF